mgnify:CR=1 FL=1
MKTYLLVVLALASYGVFARLIPHDPNFVPLTALALVGGLYLPRQWAYIVPISAMFVSDMFIGFYHPLIMLSVYGCLILATYLGTKTRSSKRILSILGITLTSSLAFYLVTNGMVWAFGTLYPKTITGLMESYYFALPFFRNSLLSDFLYTGILVGGIETFTWWSRHRASKRVEALAHHKS